jgi:DNA (cytosine-5)-methyltransferase 1
MTKRKVVSLFSGCGGLDLGFEGGFEVPRACVNEEIHSDWIAKKTRPGWVRLSENPFETVFANDIKPSARIVWSRYFGKPPRCRTNDTFVLESIVDVVKKAEAGSGPLHQLKADVVTGGFPCQDFSLAGKRKGFLSKRNHAGEMIGNSSIPTEETRGMLYFWMRKVIGLVEPKCFVAENVKGLVSMEMVKETIERDFQSIGKEGYIVIPARVLKAPNYGVAQTRERVIFLGFNRAKLTARAIKVLEKSNIDPEFDPYPQPTHRVPPKKGEYRDLFDSDLLKPAVTVREVFLGLSEPMDHPEDASHVAYSKCKWYGKHCQGQTEVDLDGQGPTIRSEHHGNIEFRRLAVENGGKHKQDLASGKPQRRLSVRECARIQSFPDDLELVIPGNGKGQGVSGSDGYKLVGNAVPPFLGYHIARRLDALWPFLFGAKG